MLHIVQERDTDRLLRSAAGYLCDTIRAMQAERDKVIVGVPGGRSVATIFEAMRQEDVDWQGVHFFMVDERLVPLDHPESNYALLRKHFIDPLTREGRITPDCAHPFLFDPAAEDRGARRYEEVLAEHGSRYDIILLSSGEDGHVGALYPNHPSVFDRRCGFIVMDDSPKPPPERMSSSLSLMQTAAVAVVLFVGEAKREAWVKFHDAACPVSACPAKLVLALDKAAVFTDLS